MAIFNLDTLLHRKYIYKASLPNGKVYEAPDQREIPILIPRIQRDYAEGRQVDSIERKRRNLLNDMLDVVYRSKLDLSFDFVYGYVKNQKGDVVKDQSWQSDSTQRHFFEPLDGQQRLTTLFLLHWLFGRNDTIKCSDSEGESLLIYQTRDTSEEFCHWLVKQDASEIVAGWESALKIVRKINKENRDKWKSMKNEAGVVDPIANRLRFPLVSEPSLFVYFQSKDSFKWDWHDDPNIRSMIIVLESAINLIKERGLSYTEGIANNKNLDHINFMLLDDLDCDGDQLFEKMNARGKPLTSFEVLKSSLEEEEMERQELPVSNPVLTNDWRKAMDIDWVDFCWDNRDNLEVDSRLSLVQKVEGTLETLMMRMVEKSFYHIDIRSTPSDSPEAVDYGQLLNCAVQGKEVGKVLDRYFDYVHYERALNNQRMSALDFQAVFDDIQKLIFKDVNGKWRDASSLIPKLNSDNTRTLLYEFLYAQTHSIRVMMYAMLAYLHVVPAVEIAKNAVEESNFKDWMRFIRNVYKPDNKTARLDNFVDVRGAIDTIDRWLDIYKEKYPARSAHDILRLIKNDIKKKPEGQEQARLEEEAIKAGLRLDGNGGIEAVAWEKSILIAEENYYLWGQIIAPLSWSRNADTYDKKEFDTYVTLLDKWLGQGSLEKKTLDALLVQAMLCYADDSRHNRKYDQDGKGELGSLGLLNYHRDHSWKRYLRDKDPKTGIYAPLFKRILDEWRKYPSLSIDEFLRHEIAAKKERFSLSDWQYYFVNISDPDTLLQIFKDIDTSGRYVYAIPNGHSYLFKSNTFRTANRFELLTCYLAYEERLWVEGVKADHLAHISDKDGAHVDFTVNYDSDEVTYDKIRLSVRDRDRYAIYHQSAGSSDWQILHDDIPVKDVEKELKALNVIHHL